MWSTKLVIQFAVVVLCIEAIAVVVMLTSPQPVDGWVLLMIALLTWPWMLFFGAALGYLIPQYFFSDARQQ